MECSRPASKKLRLSSVISNRPSPDHYAGHSKKDNDNDDSWEEDGFEIDENFMQQIETQGFSQYYDKNAERTQAFIPPSNDQSRSYKTLNQTRIKDETKLQNELDTKMGEVTNLRRLLERREKDHESEIRTKEAIIAELKKQLIGKQSEIEFQKIEKMSYISKTPKASKVTLKSPQSINSSFHKRFASTSLQTSRETKFINFEPSLHKGDVLYKLLLPSLSLQHKINIFNASQQASNGIQLRENEFTIQLESCLLQLCRFHSFKYDFARDLLKSIVTESNTILVLFHNRLSQKEVRQEIMNRKSKTITLSKMIDLTDFIDEHSLLKNTELYENEKGVPIRKVLSILTKLLEVEPTVAEMLIEKEKNSEASCNCVNRKKRVEARSVNSITIVNVEFDYKMEIDPSSSDNREFVFDVVELLHDIVQEITVRDKSNKYGGVFSCMMHLFSVLCNCGTKIYEKQQVLIVRTIKKILFSLPGFSVIHYIIKFLNVTTQMNFSYSLCNRSDNKITLLLSAFHLAAETFLENFKCFCFTKETCMLQVLCAYLEMTEKTSRFVNTFTSWICTLTSVSHQLPWICNKTDPKFCECLLMLEQNTIKVMLWCAERLNSAELSTTERIVIKSSLRRSVCILQQFRWQDADFELHIATCRGEYKRILKYLREIDDEIICKFVLRESNAMLDSKKFNLSPKTKNELNESMLKLLSQDVNS